MLFTPFLIAALILAITPGPGMAYVIARTASGGRKEGLASCLGTGLGGFVHVFAAAFGVSVIIAQSAIAFSLVKYIGAAYLIYLGLRLLLSKKPLLISSEISPQGINRAFYEGALVEALNIKTALFFLAFLPQFTSADQSLMTQLMVLGSICVLINTLMDVLAVLLAHRLLISTPQRINRERFMNQTSGVTLLGLGAYLAIADRH